MYHEPVRRPTGQTSQPRTPHTVPHQAASHAPGSLAAVLATPPSATPAQILQLQRLYGNRAVARLFRHARATTPARNQDESPAPLGAAGGEIGPELQRRLDATRGGGQPLEGEVAARLGAALGADFSGVRVHTGTAADGLNRALGATAFTTGADVFFRAGAYSPGTPGGQRLLAHELTHVVQQGAGSAPRVQPTLTVGPASDRFEQEAERVAEQVMRRLSHPPEAETTQATAEPRSSPEATNSTTQAAEVEAATASARPSPALDLGIQRSVETMGGVWNTRRYDPINNVNEHGVLIQLEFEPKDPVKATKIGLISAVRGEKAGVIHAATETGKRRTVPEGAAGAGWRTDRAPDATNPIYGADDAVSLAESIFSGTRAQDNTFGAHPEPHRKALLSDRPVLGDADRNSTQIFETTALAIEGEQAGTYYGSVRWGWNTDERGGYYQHALSLGSHGVPSANWLAAAKQWEQTPAEGGKPTLGLPLNFVQVAFEVRFSSTDEQVLSVSGDLPELGNWNLDKALGLVTMDDETWRGEVNLNANTGKKELEYQFVVQEGTEVREGSNHKHPLPPAGQSTKIDGRWPDD